MVIEPFSAVSDTLQPVKKRSLLFYRLSCSRPRKGFTSFKILFSRKKIRLKANSVMTTNLFASSKKERRIHPSL
ncbi:hypothetical protein CYJ36_23190 [Bacillus sp. UMB0893]|nr:hypothetical protein CYJ36_23190 [Bacillus sp. UMB0893]